MIPTVNGMSVSPAVVGVMPLTIWRYNGSVASPPNIPRPMTTFAPELTANVRLRNRCSGSSASSRATTSASRNSPIPTSPIA